MIIINYALVESHLKNCEFSYVLFALMYLIFYCKKKKTHLFIWKLGLYRVG